MTNSLPVLALMNKEYVTSIILNANKIFRFQSIINNVGVTMFYIIVIGWGFNFMLTCRLAQ